MKQSRRKRTPIDYIATDSGPRAVESLVTINREINGGWFYFFVCAKNTGGHVVTEQKSGLAVCNVGTHGTHMPGHSGLSLKARADISLDATIAGVGREQMRAALEGAKPLFPPAQPMEKPAMVNSIAIYAELGRRMGVAMRECDPDRAGVEYGHYSRMLELENAQNRVPARKAFNEGYAIGFGQITPQPFN
jgi:hypothetical protein